VAEAASPTDLMAEALDRAAFDSGTSGALLGRADSIRVVDQMSWRYRNPCLEVARLIGASPRQTVVSTVGGNSPQMLVNETCRSILAGELDVALICGAEAIHSRRLARREGATLDWVQQGAQTSAPDQVIGMDGPGTSAVEQARSLTLPTQIYPLFENALRAAAGETIDEHQVRISELWARLSAVATTNPFAWSPAERTALEIRTVTPANRMIGFPYPKLMNANIQVDQGAAIVVCSAEAASSLGAPPDRWVFPQAGADGHDHWFVSDRLDLHTSPAIAECGAAVASLAGVGIDDVAHVDLYSCFPSAVQIGAAELGFPLDDPARPPSVTGGLTFAGGPGNNYATHSIAAMVAVLRADPGSWGLVTALGWYISKHSVGLYSTSPPPDGFRWADVQAAIDQRPARRADGSYSGPVTVETSTVIHERDGTPSLGIVACLAPSGRRAWANTRRPELLELLVTASDVTGRAGVLLPDGDLDVI
jgi:acetyl-CoA C-acetyltransferase